MKKLFLTIMAMLMAVPFLVSCSDDDEDNGFKQGAVVAILKNSNIDYWQQIASAIESECLAKGVKPIIAYNNNDADADGQLAVAAGIDRLEDYYNIKGIIVAPVYSEDDHRVEQTLSEYYEDDNIPVVIIDSPIDQQKSPLKSSYRAYVGTDNKEAGKILAQKAGLKTSGSILSARVQASVPTVLRYQGFSEALGREVPLWLTADIETPETMKSEFSKYDGITDVVFFNGSICNSVLPALEGRNVYTFDVYKPFLENLQTGGCIKGIIAQNTFEMGRQAVLALFDNTVGRTVYIPTVYINKDNLNSAEVAPFMKYYELK